MKRHDLFPVIALNGTISIGRARKEECCQKIYLVSQSFDVVYLDALYEQLHKRLARLQRRRRA